MKHFNMLIITSIILILGTTGCWNRRELPNLSIVLGMGLDQVEESNKLEVTAQIVKTAMLQSGSSGGDSSGGNSNGAYWNVKNTGDDLFATIRDFTHKTSRKLYFPHNKIIIFGHTLAENGVEKYLDYFLRDHETRFNVLLLVAEGNAGDIFDVKPKQEKVPSIKLSEILDTQIANSMTSVITLNEFAIRIMEETTAPIAPLIEIQGTGDERVSYVKGTAVFKHDKLIGQMDKVETRGLLWVIDEVKSGIIDVNYKDTTVSMEIIRAKSKITSEIIDGKPRIKITVKEEGVIGTQYSETDLILPKTISELEKLKDAAIKAEIMSAINKAKKLNADVFGFGEVIHHTHPKEWQELRKDWDEIFPNLDLEIQVDAKIRRSGSLGPTIAPKKE